MKTFSIVAGPRRPRPKLWRASRCALASASLLLFVAACVGPVATPAIATPRASPTATITATAIQTATATRPTALPTAEGTRGLSGAAVKTLSSLKRVDDHPLYTMRYYGPYQTVLAPAQPGETPASRQPTWACSLFAALADTDNMLFGRNFDWEFSPAVLLFTNPPDGYASVSMVDIAYLVDPSTAQSLTDLPIAERKALLHAPFLPFDGMNQHGLVVGMAAVPAQDMPRDPNRETVDSLAVIREVLDHAQDVDEAVATFRNYNIDWGSGPPLHYLIADTFGRSVLIGFYRGEMLVIPNQSSWHLATNFLRAGATEAAQGRCDRYDAINQRLTETEGHLDTAGALDLLEQVSQPSTQWSVVYEMLTGDVNVVMGRHYDKVHTFAR